MGFLVSSSGTRISLLGSGFGIRFSAFVLRFPFSGFPGFKSRLSDSVLGSGFRVSGRGSRVSSLGSQVSSLLALPQSGWLTILSKISVMLILWGNVGTEKSLVTPDWLGRTDGDRDSFESSNFGFRFSGFGFWVSDFGFRVSGLGF